MSYIDHFIDPTKPLVKPKFVAVEDDWLFLMSVFPEPGFRSYFLGHIVSKLANELKANGIYNYFDRQSRPEFASVPRLLSTIQFTRSAPVPDDRRGTGSTRDEAARSAGESPAPACPPPRQTEEGEESRGETELELVRFVTGLVEFPFSSADIKKSLAQ